MINRQTVWALPGFLGQPEDWNSFTCKNLNIQAVKLDSFSCVSLQAWARQFNIFVRIQKNRPVFLLGYSLGARLALHALMQDSSLWDGAIIVSANPGLADAALKQERLSKDIEWAKRFLYEPWDKLMRAWNQQDVFLEENFIFERQEQDFDRNLLAEQLIAFSLGNQEDLSGEIACLPMPILWMVGAKDKKFSQLTKSLTFYHPLSQCQIIEQAGHRMPWAQPESFKKAILSFLEVVEKEKQEKEKDQSVFS